MGWRSKAIEDMRDKDIDIEKMIREREEDIQRQLDESRIRGARYNKRYKEINK